MDIKETLNRDGNNEYRHPWELARLEVVKKELKKITKNMVIENTNIIDIGCGDLFVLEKLNSYFNFQSLIGVDTAFDEQTINLKNKEYSNTNIRVCNNIENIKVNNKNTSIVLLLDVVEHIEKDELFLSNLSKQNFINEDTIFFITVPAFQSLFSKHDVFLQHYRRYNNSQLKHLLKKTNYKIEKMGYFFSILLLPRIFTLVKERLNKNNKQLNGTGLTKWDKGKFITHSIRDILFLDYLLSSFLMKLKIKLPGLSNYVICKKYV